MNVNIPPSVAEMGPVLQSFFEGMVFKLSVNSHKNAIRADDIDGLLSKMADEIQEFRDQRIADADDPNILSETFDVANFAFLLYAYLRSKGVRDAREQFLDEFFDIEVETGIIRCKKTRPGSPLKPGQRVWGTVRNGVRHLRCQSVASGVQISVPFRDLIWWKHTGRWPERPLKYITHRENLSINVSPDQICNLDMAPEGGDRKFPFVSQYRPKGRETTKNYGKWVYQRRHAFQLVRVGYWDSPEEAAREGIIAWKQKVKDKASV